MAAASRYAALRAHAVLAAHAAPPPASAATSSGDRQARASSAADTWATRLPPPPPPPPRPAASVERGGEAVHPLALGRLIAGDGFSTFGLPARAHRTGKVRYEATF